MSLPEFSQKHIDLDKRIRPSIIEREGGRKLAYHISGFPIEGNDRVFFLLHGLPGSLMGPKPRGVALHRAGITLVATDRPGFNQSDRKKGRTVADVAADVEAIADHLGVRKFSVVGRSAGGPHALACAALLPKRVLKAIALGSLAPRELVPDFYEGMTGDNRQTFGADENDIVTKYRNQLREMSGDGAKGIYIFDRLIAAELTQTDRDIIEDIQYRKLFHASFKAAIKNGEFGMADDAIALANYWGFDVRDIAVPVSIWSGTEDKFSPHKQSIALATKIPGSTLVVLEGKSHFDLIPYLWNALNSEIPGSKGNQQQKIPDDELPEPQSYVPPTVSETMPEPPTHPEPSTEIYPKESTRKRGGYDDEEKWKGLV